MTLLNQPAKQSLRSAETIPPRGATDSDIVHRLLREAKSAASLDHPNICRVYDVGSEAGTAFIAMQFIEGRPLSDDVEPITLTRSNASRWSDSPM